MGLKKWFLDRKLNHKVNMGFLFFETIYGLIIKFIYYKILNMSKWASDSNNIRTKT